VFLPVSTCSTVVQRSLLRSFRSRSRGSPHGPRSCSHRWSRRSRSDAGSGCPIDRPLRRSSGGWLGGNEPRPWSGRVHLSANCEDPPGSRPRGFSFRLLAARVSAPVPSQHGLASQDKSRVSWVASEFILSQIARLHPARSPRGSSPCGFVSRRRSTPSPSPSLRSPTAIISVAPRVFLASRCGSHLRTRPLGIHIVRAAGGGASHVASHNK
jgi:hypothetical protein